MYLLGSLQIGKDYTKANVDLQKQTYGACFISNIGIINRRSQNLEVSC